MSRKTSGALQIQLQTVVQALEAALSNLIEKVDALGTKIDKMPNVAKKMADGYVASFGTIAKSVEGLSSHVNKLDKIASGLTKIADGVKSFKVTEAQAKSIDRLAASFSGLGPAVAAFPKDVSGLTAFADSITSITTALGGMEGKIPSNAQIDRLNRSANSLRNMGNAVKSIGNIPPDALNALKEVRGTGGIGSGSRSVGRSDSDDGSQPPSSGNDRATGIMASVGKFLGIANLAAALTRHNVYKELSFAMPLEVGNMGDLLSGDYSKDSPYTMQMRRHLANMTAGADINIEDAASYTAMGARYTYGGNRAYGDVRSMGENERDAQQLNIINNAKLLYRTTGLDMSRGVNMQYAMGRDLGMKASDYDKLNKAFIAISHSGALVAKDLEKLSMNAKDSAMALNLNSEQAGAFVANQLRSAQALANAGIKQKDAEGSLSGFFGDEKAFIFDQLAGITDADYRKGDKAAIMKKKYDAVARYSGFAPNTAVGNLLVSGVMEGMGAGFSVEQYRTNIDRLGDATRQGTLISKDMAGAEEVKPVVPAVERVGEFINELKGTVSSFYHKFLSWIGEGEGKAIPPNKPGGHNAGAGVGPEVLAMVAVPVFGPLLLNTALYQSMSKHAIGGVVKPGASGATDSVPIMATPGEEVLSKSDPRHRDNVTNATDFFTRSGYRVTSAYRDDNPKSDHYRNRAIDIGMGHLQSPQEIAEFKSRLLADVKAQNLKVRFEEMDQYNPGTGSVSSGRHAHVYGDMAALGGAGGRIGAGKLDPGRLRKSSSAPTLADSGASSVFAGLTGLIYSQKAQQQAPLQLDPSVMTALSNIAASNSGSSDTMAQAVSMFAQVIQRLVSSSRQSSVATDLTEAVARGNYAFSRGA